MKFSTRALAVLMALLMLIGTLPMMSFAANVSEFTDFPSGSWSETALTHAVNNSILYGKGDGKIAPKDYITRAEVATIINRAFGATVKADISGYVDVDPSMWYYPEIQKAVNMQTVNGVSATEINPEGYITRESVFTIIARAMVLSDDASAGLSKFGDASSVSSWALSYTNALVNRGYINGDEKGNINPGANITREEFAQIMYNIFKTYLPEGGNVKNETYGTTVVRGRDLVLENLVINGDLVVADGVGNGKIELKNVKVSGRILFRGGEGKVTIDKNSTVGEFVIVHDVNGIVKFNNYKTESIFKGIVLDTKATFLTPAGGGGGSSGGSTPPQEKEEYTITYDGTKYTVTEGGKISDAKDKNGNKLSDVLALYKAPDGYTNKGFKDKKTDNPVDLNSKATGNIEIVPNDELNLYDLIYNANGGTVQGSDTYTEQNVLNIENKYTLNTELVVEREGYDFLGWYIDTTTEEVIKEVPECAKKETVYAKWQKMAKIAFEYNKSLSNDTTVAIDVVLDKLPYGQDAITSVVLDYLYYIAGTNTAADITFEKVQSDNGTVTGDGAQITWTGNITSGATLFTIVFTKDKSVDDNVDFKFDDIEIKNGDKKAENIIKTELTINVGTGKTRYTITYGGKEYYAYEDETIGDAVDSNGNKLSDVLNAYVAPNGYTNFGFKDKLTGDLVNLGSLATESIEIVPNNVINKYDVIYDANGGKINGQDTYTANDVLDVNTEYTLDATIIPTRDKYTFLGWYIDTTAQTIVTKVPAGSANVTVYAKWEVVYTIKYDGKDYYANEGDKIADAKDANGNLLSDVLNAYVAPNGYTNNGFKNKLTGDVVDKNTQVTKDMEIVPNDVINKYDVIYNANGGKINGQDTYTADDVLDVLNDYTLDATIIPTRDKYTFLGWYIDTTAQTIVTKVPAGSANVTVYAKWEGVYTIKYDGKDYYANEGDKIGDAKDANGNKLSDVLNAYVVPDGYTHNGFKNKATNAPLDINADATDMEIVPDNKLNKYDVTYNANGGKINGQDTYTANDVLDVVNDYTIDTTIVAVRGTYKFLGWYIDPASQTIVTKVPAGAANVTVYAKWEGAYTITYDGKDYYAYEGDKIADAKDANGNLLTDALNAYVVPDGYTHLGFKNKATNAPLDINADAAGMEIVPDNTLNKYDVIYDANGGSINGANTYTADDVLDVENDYTLDATIVPERSTYKFLGWYIDTASQTIVTKVPAGAANVTLYAKWATPYVITYDGTDYYAYDGDKIADAKDILGNALTDALNAYVTPDGYTHNGFKNSATDAPVDINADAADMEIVPDDTINKYDVIYDANGGTMDGAATYVANDVLDVVNDYTLDSTIKPKKYGYDFVGWYIDTATESVVTEVPADFKDVTVYAKWQARPASVLDFVADVDKVNGKVTLKVTLSEVPYDIDEIETMSIYYTQSPKLLTYEQTKAATMLGGSFFANEGVITWYNDSDPLTIEEIRTSDKVLFEITYTFDSSANGDVKFAFTDATEIGEFVGGHGVISSDYTKDSETISLQKQSFNVVYDANGGSINGANTYTETDVLTSANDYTLKASVVPVRYGYRFLGWYMDSATENVITVIPAGQTTDVTVYAKWEEKDPSVLKFVASVDKTQKIVTIDVTLNEIPHDTEKLESVSVYYTQVPKLLTYVGTEVSSFLGGAFSATEGAISWFNDTTPLTYEALKANGGKLFAITYKYDDATDGDITFDFAASTELGYMDGGYGVIATDYTMQGTTINLAKSTYTITFGGNTYDVVYGSPLSANAGLKTAMEAVEKKTGYTLTFEGTYLDGGVEKTETVTLDTIPSADMTIEAKYTVITYTIKYYSEGTLIDEEEYTVNDTVTLPVLSDTAEKTFGGWYTSESFDGTPVTEVAAGTVGNLTFYAKWNGVSYTITFDGNTYDVVYGTPLSANAGLKSAMEAVEQKAGYTLTFEGTYLDGGVEKTETVTLETIPYADMTIEAKYTVITYTIKYYSNNTLIDEEEYTVNDTVTLPVLPDTAEDVFEGWYTSESFDGAPVTEVAAGTVGNLTFYAKWNSAYYTVTFYEGTKNNKGSYEIEAGTTVTQAQVDAKLGAPETYSMMNGYTDSDGNAHEIAPELWYMVNGEWEKFVPEEVVITRDTDVYLFTRFALLYYDTDIRIKGVKIPRIELSVAYDSNTDLYETRLDTLAAIRDVLAGTIDNIQKATGIDLFQEALDKAAKSGLVDSEGNILNPVLPVPLHKLITEDRIMQEIDKYIDQNINNEEFIAEILRNDTVVEMLLGDESIRTKVLSDASMREKLLTDEAIKRIISKDEVIDWIITNEDFKNEFINSDATFDYILGDLKALLDNAEYHDMLIDACVEFVIDVYFEGTTSAPELIDYIDSVLDSPEFIADIESKPELRSVFGAEIKALLTDLDEPTTSQETRDELYAEIRNNGTIKNAIIDAVTSDEDIMKLIMNEVRDDLASPTSSYRQAVIDAVRAEFANPLSTLKQQIVDAVKDDIALGSSSTLRTAVINAIEADFALGATSTLKPLVTDYVKTEVGVSGSTLRETILDEASTPGSTIETYVKNYVQTSNAIKSDIKAQVKNNADVKNEARTWIGANIANIKGDIEGAVKTDADALAIAIMEADSTISQSDAQQMASKYVAGTLDSVAAAELDTKIADFFTDDVKVAALIENNFEVLYDASYDVLFDQLYADDNIFNTAYANYVSDRLKLEDAFDEYISAGTNLEDAVDAFVADGSNLVDAISVFVDNATDADVSTALDTYIADDDNLIDAINTYIANDNNLKTVFDIFRSNPDNFETAFETYIADDVNLGDAIESFANNATAFDNFYETHLGVNAADPTTFNTLFESYYHTHVHTVADKAWDNADLHDLIMEYVHDYTEEMVMDYASGDLNTKHPELVDTIDSLMHNQFPKAIREQYFAPGSTIKSVVDHLIEEEGTSLIKKYANNQIADADTVTFIKNTISDNIGIIVDDYVAGTLDADIKALIDAEIDTYMDTLINDYINNVGNAREVFGDLIPTYAQDAVDALMATDAFKNTISDFVSGNGVRVNEGNIMFVSILSGVMEEYDYNKIMADFAPAALTKLVDKLGLYQAEKYVNALLDDFVGGMKNAVDMLQADIDAGIEGTEYKFATTIDLRIYFMKDFVEYAYNKSVPKIQSKLLSINAIAINPYAQKLVGKNWLTEVLDYDASKDGEELSGYSIKKGPYDEEDEIYGSPIVTYYDINLQNKVLLHDAIMWYTNTYEIPIEEKINAVSNLLGTYANKANDLIMEYITTGELPEEILGIHPKVEETYNSYEDKILSIVDKIDDFYVEKLNKDYTEVIDLTGLSIYADDVAYPIYEIILGIPEEGKAFNIDTLATAIFDSDNYLGINAIENAMAKVKSKLDRFKFDPGTYTNKIVRDAYKVSVDAREIKGISTGNHTLAIQRYFQYIK